MGFIRKVSTHFIIQCFFDRSFI